MAVQLVVVSGPDRGLAFPLPEEDLLFVGRSRAAECRLSDPLVSRIHCQLYLEGGRVTVTDFESAGGTFINGRRISGEELTPDDTLRVGATELRLGSEDSSEGDTAFPDVLARTAAVKKADPAELVGKALGDYEVGAVLARGQTGIIFHGRHVAEDRPVAVKVLYPSVSGSDQNAQRLLRAVKAVLPLRHPHLVALYDAGRAGPYCWAAMEYVEGENLVQAIQRIGVAGMLDWRHAFRVAVHVGRALDFLHGRGIVHRNVLPQNILVRSGNKAAVLGDLMLAKGMGEDPEGEISVAGAPPGDVRYLAPEQTYGSAGGADGRADIYGLGATVYALLTGRPPFAGASAAETVAQVRRDAPARPTKYQMSIPARFEDVVLKMLAKEPEKRYQTGAELLAELERVGRFQGFCV
jgi:serine/threonine protein kinase